MEPTFEEIVIVYRTKKDADLAEAEGRVAPIHIKSFANMPIADFEVGVR